MGEGDILVLGGTSLIGRFFLPRMAAAGRRAVVLSRVERRGGDGARWVVGDLTQPETLGAAGRATAVVSLSPIWLLTPDALAALHGLGMTRLVAFSSTSRFTKTQAASDKERAVAQALADGEAAVEAFCTAHGVGFTILRPTLIYAEGQDGNVSRLAGLIRRFGVLPLPGAGRSSAASARAARSSAWTGWRRPRPAPGKGSTPNRRISPASRETLPSCPSA
jgi:nucleoside-diphosphate-sugar epimerase